MPSKKLTNILTFAGAMAGGYVPALFGIDLFSFTTFLISVAGGLLGFWLAYRLSK